MGPKTGLDALEKRQISYFCRESDLTVLAGDIFRSAMKGFVPERFLKRYARRELSETHGGECVFRDGRRDLVEMCRRFEEISLQLQSWRYCSSETLVSFCHTVRYHIPEDSNLQNNMNEISTLEPTWNC
jgi:hypothetical protein